MLVWECNQCRTLTPYGDEDEGKKEGDTQKKICWVCKKKREHKMLDLDPTAVL